MKKVAFVMSSVILGVGVANFVVSLLSLLKHD